MFAILLILYLFVITLICSRPFISELFREVQINRRDIHTIIQQYRDKHSIMYLIGIWVIIFCWFILFSLVNLLKSFSKFIKS